MGHEAKGLSCSLAVGLRPPSLLDHGGLSIRQLTTWQVQANETTGEGTRGRSRSLGNLFPEMIVHLFCCIMFVGSKSLGPAHTQGQWIIRKHGSQEAAITGSHRESCPPHPASSSTLASLPFNTRDRPLSQLVCSPNTLPTWLTHLTSLKSSLGCPLFSAAVSDHPIQNCSSPQPLFSLPD